MLAITSCKSAQCEWMPSSGPVHHGWRLGCVTQRSCHPLLWVRTVHEEGDTVTLVGSVHSTHWKLGYFIYLISVCAGLHCCALAFSSFSERGYIAVRGLLTVVESRAQALGTWASLAVVHRLRSCSSQVPEHELSSHGFSCLRACGIFPDQALTCVPWIGRQTLICCATREISDEFFLMAYLF